MNYLRITEINIEKNEKFDKYNYYFNNDLKELELNKGFTLTKQVISQLLEISTINKVIVTIIVIDDKLNYLIGYDGNEEVKFNNVKVEKIIPDKMNFKYESSIYGVINPSNINLKQINIIDELLIENRGNNFALQIELEKDLEMMESSEYLSELADLIEKLSSQSEVNINEQEHLLKNIWKGIAGGEGRSFKIERIDGKKQLNRLKEQYEVLSVNQNKIKIKAINIFSNDNETYKMIQSKLISVSKMNIGNSIFFISKDDKYLNTVKYITLDYIIPIIAFPISDVAGLTVTNKYEYGADIVEKVNENIVLGRLNKNGKTKIDINYDINDLLMHTFITGVTGSGKTSTVKKIISEVIKNGKPFLIIEPAKSEYKFLSNIINLNRYQLGIEMPNSFRLNPFEFPENIHIQTHLDNIKSVFIASFPMQGPMPYILETAFYNIYRKVGWDLISSINIYSQSLERKYLYPTLEDLYYEIDSVTEEVGYSKELTDDVKGALKVRIGSLLSGAKGAMLNTNESNRMEEVLSTPTVIELESIGDSQEKVFLMGLLLTSIYEHYVSKGIYSDEIQNLLVIEEAHRLLENTTTINNNDIGDMKGKALENFNNILSEIRAYGQGIVVADQIPSKLSPDVIKNTNLKIIHRLYANDDRELVGHSIGLDNEKINGFVTLDKGQAIMFHSKISSPIKVDINIDDEKLLDKNKCLENQVRFDLNLENIIIKNEVVVNEMIPTINSFLITDNGDCQNLKKIINDIIEKYYNAEILKKYKLEVNQVIKAIIAKYIKSIYKQDDFILTYPNQVKFINGVYKSSNPIEYFKINIEKYIKYNNEEKIHELVDGYNLIKLLYSINNLEKYNILLLVKKYESEFKQENYFVQDDVIRVLKLNRYFRVSSLSEKSKANLVDSLVIYYLKDSLEIINLYFGIGEPAKISENKGDSNIVKINNLECQFNKIGNLLEEAIGKKDNIIELLRKNIRLIMGINIVLAIIIMLLIIF